MLFDELLIHTCDLRLPGEIKTGEDKWGRPIYEKHQPKTVDCRYMAKNVYVKDTTGTDRVLEMSMFLKPDTEIDEAMTVENIKDDKGNLLTTAKLEVDSIVRHYDNQTLHHFKVFLKGAE